MQRRAALLVGLAGMLAGACASEQKDALLNVSSGGDGRDQLVAAIEKTAAVESADLEMSIQIGPNAFEVAGEWTRSGVGETTAHYGTGEVTVRSDGETAWLQTDDPQVVAELPEGVIWIEAPHAELIESGILTSFDQTWDPLLYLQGIETVDDLGSEDGLQRFRAEIDYEKAFEGATDDEEEALRRTIQFDFDAVVEFEAEVAIDDEGRVRRLAYDVSAEPQGGSDVSLPMSLTMEVHEFDQPIEAPEPPPADETVPLSEIPDVLGLLGGTAGSNDVEEPVDEPADNERPDPEPPPADTAADGLEITTLREGSGPGAEKGDTVTVHYVGKTADGEVFDTSWDREPFPVTLGEGLVIEGWEEGLIGAKVGERRRLVFGADYGYGAAGAPPDIPPNASLAFEVDILDIQT